MKTATKGDYKEMNIVTQDSNLSEIQGSTREILLGQGQLPKELIQFTELNLQ